ncbi:hypothetical protein EI555_000550 [Monodon monoceros]|uniref:CTNNB1 binding N-teminal domain-containing protein n=1 Tax=Monodon monoceros TaxID=40151 RepID=A0A4U1FH81_MONMO|nr:hypothetical protein EI555_000550 [Monodon monoceros]
MIPFKDEGDPQKEKIFAEISHPEEEGDLADIKSSLVNESEIIPASNGHEVARQAQTSQDSYHDKAREHPDDDYQYVLPASQGPISSVTLMHLQTDFLNVQSNKVPVVQPSHAVHPLTPLITYSDEHFSPGSHPSHIPSDVSSKQGPPKNKKHQRQVCEYVVRKGIKIGILGRRLSLRGKLKNMTLAMAKGDHMTNMTLAVAKGDHMTNMTLAVAKGDHMTNMTLAMAKGDHMMNMTLAVAKGDHMTNMTLASEDHKDADDS